MEEEHGPAQHPVQDGEGAVQRHSLLVLGRRTCVTKAMSAAQNKLFVSRCIRFIQGADDKLGQFLDQDIEATANHRNVFLHFLESCPSLVSPYVNKPSIFTKICRQNTKLVQ